MGLSDYIVSVIRTLVPAWVASALTWLAAATGVIIDQNTSVSTIALVVSLVVGGYYTLARALESRYPALGWLLGAPKPPTYRNPE